MGNLTEDKLLEWGFKNCGKEQHGRGIAYRIEPPKHEDLGYYSFEIQIVLNSQYGNDNPNCGIVSIHSPACEAGGVPKDLLKKEKWTVADHKRAQNYKIKLKEWTQPIAWYVTTEERLKRIYFGLTQLKLGKIKKGQTIKIKS